MTALCAHPGCMVRLAAGNASGVCRQHLHDLACRCARCRASPSPAQRRFAFARAVAAPPDLPLAPLPKGTDHAPPPHDHPPRP